MKKVLIIGGGFAGLSAAVFLAKENFKVTLIEASPNLGGRARSFYSHSIGENVDNGQHILMGCYSSTLKFLKTINALNNFERFKNLEVPFIEKGGRQTFLKVRSFFYPLNLVAALSRFNAVPIRKRIKLFIPFFSLLSPNESSAPNLSSWLISLKQDSELQKAFWNVLSVGAMNTTPEFSDVKVFKNVLSQMFLRGNKGFNFILPKKGLTEAYVLPARDFIISRGGKILLSERVLSVEKTGQKIAKVITNKAEYSDFNFVVSSIPFPYANKIFGTEFYPGLADNFHYSPILNLHVKLKSNPLTCKFAALIDSKIHWVFNHGNYITLVTSAAENLISKSKEELKEILLEELQNYIPLFYKELVEGMEIIKEKRATFVPSANLERLRKKIQSPFENLILSGDWTYAGLPATIESAVLSGIRSAETILTRKS